MPIKINFSKSNNGKLTLSELWGCLLLGWYWLIGGAVIGLLVAFGFYLRIPVQYEASAIIKIASIAEISPQNSSPRFVDVESVAQLIERLRFPTFYPKSLVDSCYAKSPETLASSLKLIVVKGLTNNIKIVYRGLSPKIAETCIIGVIDQINLVQSTTVLRDFTRAETEQQLFIDKKVSDFVSNINKLAKVSSLESVLLQKELYAIAFAFIKGSSVVKLSYYPTTLLSPIYVPETEVPRYGVQILMFGLLLGLMLGACGLLMQRITLCISPAKE